jgi:hypothetical protein
VKSGGVPGVVILVHYLPSLSRIDIPASGTPGTEADEGRCPAEFPKWRPVPI